MDIKIKNKFLYFDKYRIKCAIGKRGIVLKKTEGDNKTPKGSFTLKALFYRKDRIPKIQTVLTKKIIKKNLGWCDDINSKYYNKIVKLPFNFSAEKLWLSENIYDLIVIINYNIKPVIKNKGSAIFLHIAKKKFSPTKGCIAITKKDMFLLLAKIKRSTKIIIN
jgi:L,D-peptidoglycan transpeptidase YkuD (ErfK/YbiS/YcfS/YnhG family)|tara:strand:- start:603 stop:1094 length:492 start_codon:yes stop_codon:yes gene_type:complete